MNEEFHYTEKMQTKRAGVPCHRMGKYPSPLKFWLSMAISLPLFVIMFLLGFMFVILLILGSVRDV